LTFLKLIETTKDEGIGYRKNGLVFVEEAQKKWIF